ncbi:MAG: WbqC family protein [Eubacterium sp.]|nr:WbqC family protein [Eubacterium sp.]
MPQHLHIEAMQEAEYTVFDDSVDIQVLSKHFISLKLLMRRLEFGLPQEDEKDSSGGAFTKKGIRLCYHHYIHPQYRQAGTAFISHIGIYDLLFNEGFEKALPIIRSGDRTGQNRVEQRSE